MPKQRYQNLLEKAISAAISAIEIYNKPDFKYREETFAILMINAWEVLLKAKILKDNGNDLNSIYVPEKTKTQTGKPLKRFYPKKNRCGNPMTIEINGAISQLKLPNPLRENLELLIQVRDNAIHFLNKEPLFEKKVLEIGTANLKSFVQVFNEWFDYDLSQYNFYLMPISFFHSFEVESFSINKTPKQIQNLLKHIASKESEHPSNEQNNHNISLRLETKFARTASPEALSVKFTSDDPNAVSVTVNAENQFAKKYPLDYAELLDKLRQRYSDFKLNKNFYSIKAELQKNEKYSKERYLDMKANKGSKKRYYSTEILKEFDKKYTKKNKNN